jgi:hypothetical protein
VRTLSDRLLCCLSVATAETALVCPGRGSEANERLAVVDDPLFAIDGVQLGAPIAELDALTELDAEEVLRGDKAARLAEEARLAREEQVCIVCLSETTRLCCRRLRLFISCACRRSGRWQPRPRSTKAPRGWCVRTRPLHMA